MCVCVCGYRQYTELRWYSVQTRCLMYLLLQLHNPVQCVLLISENSCFLRGAEFPMFACCGHQMATANIASSGLTLHM